MITKMGRTAVLILAPLLILLLPVAVYATDRWMNSGDLPRNVSVAGVDVAGLTPAEALAVVRAEQDAIYAQPSLFVVNGTTFELDPADVGLTVEVETAVAQIDTAGDDGLIDGLLTWVRSFTSTAVDTPVQVGVDGDAIDRVIERWEREAIRVPAFDGDIRIVGRTVEIDYPRAGLRIDREAAHAVVESALLAGRHGPEEIPLLDLPPALTTDDLDDAAATVEQLVSRPVTLRNAVYDATLVVTPTEIADAVTIEFVVESPASIDIGLDPEMITAAVEPRAAELEEPPVEVQIDTNVATGRVSVTPPKNGSRVDFDALTPAVFKAALGGGRGSLPIVADVEPDVTIEEVEAWGPLELVSSFTTRYPSGQPRVTNIHTMAKTIDGSIVWPGETFSINETVGRRTEAKGYVRDGAIINGEVYCCDSPTNVGGGVSQFGTTFFNAVFFGGYEDVEHQPHSIYFSKYPEGREATLGYPHPDVVFRNNTDAPVIIRTGRTASSVTVLFFGNNGGLKVESERSERRNFTEPRLIYEENPSLKPGEERVVSRGSEGWTVTVTRVITYPDGTVVREPFVWRYRGNARKIQVPSCSTVPGSVRCTAPPDTTTTVPPDTTTTTLPEETTTTLPPDTTTTVPPTTVPPTTVPPTTVPPTTVPPTTVPPTTVPPTTTTTTTTTGAPPSVP
ncbi:MAG: VanW family protein [Acidimicrobiia bacterium]